MRKLAAVILEVEKPEQEFVKEGSIEEIHILAGFLLQKEAGLLSGAAKKAKTLLSPAATTTIRPAGAVRGSQAYGRGIVDISGQTASRVKPSVTARYGKAAVEGEKKTMMMGGRSVTKTRRGGKWVL